MFRLEVETGLRGLTAACEGALLSLEVEAGLGCEQLRVEELCSAWKLGPD